MRLLLDAGADPGFVSLGGDSLPATARDRGHLEVAELIEKAIARRARTAPADPGSDDHEVHEAAEADDTGRLSELVARLLEAGARVPPVLTACRSYLLEDPELLELLLASGMDPDLPDWQRATPLHALCGRDSRRRPHPRREACAAVLLDAGASLTARDLEYLSTPLAWAARCDLPEMAELLLARGAPAALPDGLAWATPLAWATRRGNAGVADLLRRAGARA